jgi:PAS domain S-box-containing protein
MTTQEVIAFLATALGSGGLGAFLHNRIANRKQDESEFTTLIDRWQELYEKQLEKEKRLEKRIGVLEKEVGLLKNESFSKDGRIEELQHQLMIFESSHADVPVPIWLKDTNGKMLFLNSEYERQILNPIGLGAEAYIGKTDEDVWGESISNKFAAHDKKVMRLKRSIEFKEVWRGSNGIQFEGRVIKYPRFLNNKTVIGVGGIILDINIHEKTIKK